jgi:hypothetical protein
MYIWKPKIHHYYGTFARKTWLPLHYMLTKWQENLTNQCVYFCIAPQSQSLCIPAYRKHGEDKQVIRRHSPQK